MKRLVLLICFILFSTLALGEGFKVRIDTVWTNNFVYTQKTTALINTTEGWIYLPVIEEYFTIDREVNDGWVCYDAEEKIVSILMDKPYIYLLRSDNSVWKWKIKKIKKKSLIRWP